MASDEKTFRDDNWGAALVRFLDAVTELTKIGTKALQKELDKKE